MQRIIFLIFILLTTSVFADTTQNNTEQTFEDFRSPSKILGEAPVKGVNGSSSICQVLLREPSWIDVPLFVLPQIVRLCVQLGDIKPLFQHGGLILLLVLLMMVYL